MESFPTKAGGNGDKMINKSKVNIKIKYKTKSP